MSESDFNTNGFLETLAFPSTQEIELPLPVATDPENPLFLNALQDSSPYLKVIFVMFRTGSRFQHLTSLSTFLYQPPIWNSPKNLP